MPGFAIRQILALKDNYVYLLHDEATGETAVVDPSEAAPVEKALGAEGWRLTHILNTHHHWDHTGGNEALKAATGARIVGPRADAERIPGIDEGVGEGDRVAIGRQEGVVIEVPGHTRGHIAFWFAGARALFCGDTLFTLGCGRMFEGTPEVMWASLAKLRALPDDAMVHCGHEYTEANARFALFVDPGNAALQARAARVTALRAEGRPTVPASMAEERAGNPFLRADDPALQAAAGLPGGDPAAVFGALRRRKDSF